ncbi:retention module-containing protein [Metapseudomonas otitidis]|uniref:retention module-containing protein n=1 Tax=Metapseudomonas otitidis TaxID=319939 RepID=UPI0013F67423|nr:retention module-containing protein [Pseudomonas otitidis]
MSTVVAVVKSVIGQVVALSAEGVQRQLFEGDRIFQGDEIVTGAASMVTIELPDGRLIDLGRDTRWASNDFAPQVADDGAAQTAPSAEELQQAIAAGVDPTQAFEATAAGATSAGGTTSGGEAGGGRSFVLLDPTGGVVEAQIGFATQGLANGASGTDETQGGLPNIAPQFTGADGGLITTFSLSTPEDTPISGTFTASDANGDLITFSVTQGPANGTLVFNPNGTWTYTPAQDYNGADSFVVTATDGRGASTPLTVNLGITPVNDAPVASGTYTADVNDTAGLDTFADIKGQLTATDVDDTQLTWSGSGKGAYGELTVNADGTYTYVVDAQAVNGLQDGEQASDSFVVTVRDPSGASDTRVITINFNGANDAPIATASSADVTEDQTVSGTLQASDADKGAVLSYSLTNQPPAGFSLNPQTGAWTLDAGNAAYQSLAEGQKLTLTVPYEVTDQFGAKSTSTLTITVTGVNDAAVLGSADVQLDETDSALTTGGTLSITDVDSPATFVTQTGTAGNYGTFSIDAAGNWSYIANSAYNELNVGQKLVDTFQVTSADGTKTSVTVTINGTNDAAVLSSADVQLDETGSALTAGGALTITDVDSPATFVAQSGTAGTYGTFSIDAAGNWSYVANAAYNELNVGQKLVDTFEVTSADGTKTSVTVTINGTNDAPVAVDDTVTLDEDSVATGNVLTNDSDVDSTKLSVTGFSIAGQNYQAGDTAYLSVGKLTLLANGEFSFTPNADYSGVVPAVTYTLSDGSLSTTGTLQLVINPINDAPVNSVPGAQTLDEDGSQTFSTANGNAISVADVDGDTLTTTLSVGHGTLTLGSLGNGVTFSGNGTGTLVLSGSAQAINAALQGLKYVPSADYNGPDTLNVRTSDGQLSDNDSIGLTINPVNDAPVAGATSAATEEDAAPIGGQLDGSDVDGDKLTYTLDSPAPDGFQLNPNGTWTLDPSAAGYQSLAKGQVLTLTIPYSVSDGSLNAKSTLTITVTGTNDAPKIDAATAAANEGDGVITGQMIATDVDTGAQLTFTTPATVDGLTLNSNGNWSFDSSHSAYDSLKAGEQRVIKVPVTVTDEFGASNTANLEITVTGTNDAPVASAVSVSGSEDQPARIQVDLAGSDVDGSVTGFVITGLPQHGQLYTSATGGTPLKAGDNVTGPVYFVPDSDWNGTTTFQYQAVDNDGATSTSATATVNVSPVNDAPVASPTSAGATEDGPTVGGQLAATDVDGDKLTFSLKGNAPAGFSLNPDGTWTLDPSNAAYQALADGEKLVIQVPFTATDGQLSSDSVLTLTITGINDAPVVTGAISVGTDEDAAGQVIDLLAKASDTDAKDVLNVVNLRETSGNDASGVTVSGNTLVLDPSAYNYLAKGEKVTLTYEYQVSDGHGGLVTTQATVVIDGVNDAPVVSAAITTTTNEDAGAQQVDLLQNASDVDRSDVLSVANVKLVGSGDTAGVTVSGSTLQVNPNAYNYLAAGEKLVLTYSYDVVDGNGGVTPTTATLTIEGRNDAPVLETTVQSGSVTERADGVPGENAGNLSATGDIGFEDADLNDTHSVSTQLVSATNGNGQTVAALGNLAAALSDSATGDGQGSVHWTYSVPAGSLDYLAAGETLTLVYRVTVTDGSNASASRDVTITVTGSNDAPVVSGAVTSVTNEDAPAYSIDLLQNASDVDAKDVLSVVNLKQIGIGNAAGVTFDAASNSLKVDPSAYNYLAKGQNLVLNYEYEVSDGQGGLVKTSASITIEGRNDAPAVDSNAITVAEESVGTPLGLKAPTDVDGDALTVTVTGLPVVGRVTLADGSTVSNGQTLTSAQLQGLKYNAPADYKAGDPVGNFTYSVNDGTATVVGSVAIGVTAVNDLPVVDSKPLTVAEESVGTPLGLKAPTDVDGDALTITVTGLPVVGQVTLADGTLLSNGQTLTSTQLQGLKYNAPADYKAGDPVGSFTYSVNDGTATVNGSVAISVTPVNDLPVVDSKPLTVAEESVGTPLGLKAPTDADGDVLTIKVTGLPVVGQVTLADGTLVSNGQTLTSTQLQGLKYNAPADYKAGDPVGSFTYSVNDGTATVNGSVTINVTQVNDAPDARDDAPTLSGLKGSYYAYREGTDGPNLSNLAMVKDFIAKHAADATFTATSLNYGNGTNSHLGGNGNLQKFLGSDAASLSTAPANSSDAIVELSGSINLAAGNYQLRVTADDGFSIVIDGKVVAEYNGNQGPTAREFATFNVPAGGAHQIQIIYWDQGGQALLKVEMRPEGGSYTVLGGNSLSHGLDGLVTAEDTPLTIEPATLLGNDTDVDGDSLTIVSVQNAVNGTVALVNGKVVFTPAANFNGTGSFTYTVSDGKGGTDTATVKVGVTAVNDLPVVDSHALTVNEESVGTPLNIAAPTDVDGDALTITVTGLPVVGQVTLADGTLVSNGQTLTSTQLQGLKYNAPADYKAGDTVGSFTYSVNDGTGTVSGAINLAVTPINDLPVVNNANVSVDEDDTLTSQLNATDADGDSLTYTLKTGTSNGTLVLDNATGQYTYKPNANYNGPDSFTVTIDDGKGGVVDTVVRITVNPVNDAPTANPANLSTAEDTPVNGKVDARDIDGDTLTYSIASGNGPQNGTLTLYSDGSYTYRPNKDYNGPDAFTVTVSDGKGGTTTSLVSIDVTPVNDAPITADQAKETDEDQSVNGKIVASDVEGDKLTYTVKTGTANGTLTLDPNTGEYTYKPNGDYNGPDRFVVTVSDGKGGVVDTVVDITVKPVNDAPTAVNDTATTQEDTTVTLDVLANDRDVDGDSLALTGATAQHGNVSIVDGKLVYTPTGNYSGADTITYTITDGKGGNSTATVQVGIQAVADAPNLGTQAPGSGTAPAATGLLQQSWNNLALGSGGNGVNPATLKSAIDAAGTPTSSGNLSDAQIDSVNAGVANKLSGLIYLEAGQTYTFSGTGDDSVMVVVGGTTVGSATWGGNGGQFSGSYTAQQSGYYTLDIYQHNQSGPGALDVNVKVGNGPVQDLSSANVQLYTKASDLTGNGLHLSDLHGSDGKGYYQLYNANEGDEDSSIPLSRLTASLNDTDGSESLSVGISQIPEGATLTDGVNSFTATSGSTTADISGWNLGNLSITPPANYSGSFDLKVTATATEGANGDKASTSLTLPVTVHPLNDAPTGADNSVRTDEGTPRSFSAAEFGFSDVDAGDSLKAIRINSLPGNGSLSLNGTAVTVGMLVTAAQIASLVYTPTASGSSNGSFSFSVQDQSGQFSTQPNTMTIQVANLDDAPGLADSSVTFAENTGAGTTIADLSDRFTGTDQDRDGEPLFYSITGGNDAGLFSINASTGVITLANGKTLDYETATRHQLQVSATDSKTAATATVTVNVTNVNDNGVAISDSDTAANQVNENAVNGTVVGVTAKGVDGDAGATITQYELVDNAGGRFAINATTGVVTVADGTKLDYESATSHTIVVKATSSDGSTNTQSFTIQVGNINDNGVVITDSNTAANQVNENAANGSLVGITAKGVDGDAGATITQYELVDNAGGRFAINATSGVVTVADGTKLDYESATSHTIVVKATSSDGSTNTQSFTIQVGNINDNGVVITDSNTAANQVNENAANGTVVGITAKGVDGDVGATITQYELVDNAGGRFAINATTGVVTVADGTKLDYETATSHTIVVKATSSDGSTNTQSFNIQVNNVNEAPVVVAGANVNGVEDTHYTFAWSDFKVSDVDANSTLSIKVESLPIEGKLQMQVNGAWTNVTANTTVTKSVIDAGGLRFVPDSNESGHDSFGGTGVGLNQATYATFKYSGSDGALSTASSTMSIDIAPVADVPTLTVKSAATSTLFTTTWDSAPNSNSTSQDVAGPTFEDWTLVTTGDVRSGGRNVFEVWANGDSMQNQAGNSITVRLPGTNNGDALELNDAGGNMSQTLGVTRNVATEVGKVYELNMDYAGRLGFDASFTKIAVYLGNTLVGEYSSTSSQTSLNWENIHFSFTGTGKTEALTIKLAGTSTDSAGRGALIDNITLTSSQGVVAGDGGVSGKTSIALANYISGALTDTDGSESLRYDLSNLPSGASVVVGNTTLTATNGVISLTAAQLATAKLQVSGSVRGEIDLDVKAVSVEPNGNTASSASQHLTLKIVDGGVGHESLTTNTINVADTSTALSSGLTGEYWGYAESGSTRPNLTSLKLVEDYVESRSGNSTSLIGSNDNAAAASVNATFVANVIDYGLRNGSPVFSDDLGDNRSLSNGATIGSSGNNRNNLYDFLTAASTGNVSNLKAGGAGLGDTSDAIIRAHGFLDLAQGGTYDIRVTADDGYRLMIGGQVVAEADYIQSTTSKVFSGIGLSGDLQALELLYWDQGAAASLKVEFKLSGSADSTYKVLGASGSGLEIFQAPGAGQELVQTDTGWALHTIGTTNGTEASDLINGSKYADILNGGNGHDVLYGNAGHDLLNGGDGNDLLIGGVGNDTLTGGAGADIFVWKAGDIGNDVIKDFNAGEGDRIDLSDLLPDAANANNILDYLKVDTTTSTLQVSTSGNVANGADVTIKLEGVDLTQYGSTSSQIVSSLVAGSDPLVKTEHS